MNRISKGTFATALVALSLAFTSSGIAFAGGRPPHPGPHPGPHPTPLRPPTFTQLLNRAVQIVHQRYPGAQFLEADGSQTGKGVVASDVKRWRFVFNLPHLTGCKTNGTVFLPYAGGRFHPLTVICSPFLEDRVVKLPVRFSLERAIQQMRKAGFLASVYKPFNLVTLRHPLGPSFKEPRYIFQMFAQHVVISVGASTGSVSCSGVQCHH